MDENIKVGYATFSISRMSEDHSAESANDGFTELSKQRILIGSFDNPQHEAKIKLHEILHAVVSIWGIDFEDDESEEKIVTTLACALSTVLADNPAFFIRTISNLANLNISDKKIVALTRNPHE